MPSLASSKRPRSCSARWPLLPCLSTSSDSSLAVQQGSYLQGARPELHDVSLVLTDHSNSQLSKSQEENHVRRYDGSQRRFNRARFWPRVQRGSHDSSLRVSGTGARGPV